MGANTPPPDRTDDPADPYADDPADEDDTWLSSFSIPYGGRPAWPLWGRADDETASADEESYGTRDDTWLDEGVIGLILVVGVVLFVVPEPATTTLGIALVGLGLFLWVLDWLAPEG